MESWRNAGETVAGLAGPGAEAELPVRATLTSFFPVLGPICTIAGILFTVQSIADVRS